MLLPFPTWVSLKTVRTIQALPDNVTTDSIPPSHRRSESSRERRLPVIGLKQFSCKVRLFKITAGHCSIGRAVWKEVCQNLRKIHLEEDCFE